MARRLSLSLGLALCLAAAPACQRAASESSQAKGPDPRADGRRLTTAAVGWPARWKRVGELPSCTPLLDDSQRPLCDSAAKALAAIRSESARPASEESLLAEAGRVALAAQRVTTELRRKGLEKFAIDQKGEPRPIPSAAPPPSAAAVPSVAPPKKASPAGSAPLPLASAREHITRRHDNPHVTAIQAYSNLATLGLRQIAVYLENGPLPTRALALEALRRVEREEPSWKAPRNIAREAALTETDPALKRELLTIADGKR